MKGGQDTRDWESGNGKSDGRRTESQDRDGKVEKEENIARFNMQERKGKTKKKEEFIQRHEKEGTNQERQTERENGKAEAESE